MKKKQSAKKSFSEEQLERGRALLFGLFWILAALSWAMRLHLVISLMDHETGFYWSNSRMILIFRIAVVVSVGLLCGCGYFWGRTCQRLEDSRLSYHPHHRLLSALLGLFALTVGCSSAVRLFRRTGGGQPDSGSAIPAAVSLAVELLGLLAAAVLLWVAVRGLLRREAAPGPLFFSGWLMAVPVLWQLFSLLTTYLKSPVRSGDSERVLETVVEVGFLLFLFFHARILSGMDSLSALPMGLLSGLAGGYLAIVYGLPGLSWDISNSGLGGVSESHLTAVLLGVYMVLFCSELLRQQAASLRQQTVPQPPAGMEEAAAPSGSEPEGDGDAPAGQEA